MARIASWEDLQNFFHVLVDDELDEDAEVELANVAKDEIEGEMDWEMLKDVDETQSSVVSDTYKTGPKTLPANYLHTCNGGNALYIGSDRMPYFQIPFERREEFQNTARRWYLKMKDGTYYVAATGVSGTHRHFYIARSDDITTDSTSLWKFPSRYNPLIAFKMAELFYPTNVGEKVRSWDDRWALQRGILHDGLVRWNWRLQGNSHKNARNGMNIDSLPDAIDTNKR